MKDPDRRYEPNACKSYAMHRLFNILVSLAATVICGVRIGLAAAHENAEVDANGNVRNEQSSSSGAFHEIFGSSTLKNFLQSITRDGTRDENSGLNKEESSLDDILSIARNMAATASSSKSERSIPQLIEHFKTHFDESASMMKSAFAHVDFSKLSLASLWYYIEKMERERTPSWKRRVHRYHKRISLDTILELHDVLYLMQVAYLPSKDLIREHVEKFRNGEYELIDAVTTGNPTEPAHFIMIPKTNERRKLGVIPKEKSTIAEFWNDITKSALKSSLEVVIAIRGTGDIGDLISDSMLNATSYRKGVVHDGIARAGKYIVGEYIGEIRKLLEASGRDRVEVTLIGYSLGAGVAAIAAMELNDHDFIGEHNLFLCK
jgi:hypothetical protein